MVDLLAYSGYQFGLIMLCVGIFAGCLVGWGLSKYYHGL